MSITIVQLVPLAVTFFALALTGPALNPAPTRVRKYFVLLNLSVFMWSFGVFMQFSGGNTVIDPTVMVFGSGAYLWFLLVVTGITATPTAWFFFAVEYAGIRDHMPRWLLRLACAPLVLSITFGVLNPWTQQIARLGQETGLVEYPAIAFAYSLVLAVLSVSGAYMLVRYSLQRDRTERIFAHLLALVSFLPTLALVIWSARGALGLNLSFDAAPLMLLVFDGLVGLLIYMQRFAEIIPRATLDAFEHIRDSALIMNHRGLIMAMNASARQSMRGIMPGDELSQARPELAHRLQECFKEAAPPRNFEMRISDRVYRVRPRRTSSSVRERSHCVVLLNDVTDLRHAEEKLRVLHGDTLIRLSDRRTRN